MLAVNRFTCLIKALQPNSLQHIVRMAHLCSVKNPEDSDRLEVNLEYGHQGGPVHLFNANRLKTEPLLSTLTRIGSRIESKINKGNKKRKRKEAEEAEQNETKISIQVKCLDGTNVIGDEIKVCDAFVEGNLLVIEDEQIPIHVNLPWCGKITLPQMVMVGFPIFPVVELEYLENGTSEYKWEKITYEEVCNTGDTTSKKRNKPETPRNIKESIEVSNELIYTPVISDINYYLRLTCLPKSGDRQGKAESAVTKFEVGPGPGLCPFENRHVYTQKETGPDEVRVVCYNILADLYADQDFSRDVLFSYCPPYALSIDYRKPLLIKEIQGYKGDLLCLQEVDAKVFKNELITSLGMIGYEGFFMEKGDSGEGSAIFHRKSKFRLLEHQGEVITNVLETNSQCQDIVKKAYTLPKLKEVIQNKKSVIHILVLEPIEKPDRVLLIANTHLYFHPDAGHVRMVQALVAMRYIDTVLQKYKSQNPSLVFCGDFNSTPLRAIYEFMTTKSVKEDNIDWNDGGPEQFMPGMNFNHSLNIASGCGVQPYTNYTNKFNGHLDYIFYDADSFGVSQVIPQPEHREVELNTAIPSVVFPSDHIAQVCDLRWKQ